MYEWKYENTGYSKEDAEKKRDEIISAGGVARVEYLEGYEMGSGPHFQGYGLHWIEPEDLKQHVGHDEDDVLATTIQDQIDALYGAAEDHLSTVAAMNNKLREVDLDVYQLYVGALLKQIKDIITLEQQLKRAAWRKHAAESTPVGLYGGGDK
jgi:hypothetical protein